METLLFVVSAALSLLGGVGVVASREAVHSALSLLLVLGALAVLYLTLAAEFLAVLQVILYAGAIVVLFLFVIMLLHAHDPERRPSPVGRQWVVAIPLGLLLWAVLAYASFGLPTVSRPVRKDFGTVESVGRELFGSYLLPFEVAAVLILVAIVAALVLGSAPSRSEATSSQERGEAGRRR